MKNINRFNSSFSFTFLIFVLGFITSLSVNANSIDNNQVDTTIEKALSLKADLNNGRLVYRNCALCHTPEGWGNKTGRFPQISGQHKSVILKQLADIHKGNRDNPTMIPFTRSLMITGSQSLADVSAYIEQLKMMPNNSFGSGFDMDKGKKIYEKNCEKCHGANGEGDAEKFYPRIHGQHYNYLLRQLLWIKNSKRRNADKKMVEQINDFSIRDLELIADYVSRLRADPKLVAESANWKNPDFRSNYITAPR